MNDAINSKKYQETKELLTQQRQLIINTANNVETTVLDTSRIRRRKMNKCIFLLKRFIKSLEKYGPQNGV